MAWSSFAPSILRESLHQSAAALSGSFAPANRFENLEIRRDFQTSIWNKPPCWSLLWFHQRFLGFSTFSKFLILFYHITGILARAWAKLRIIPAKLQDFRCVSRHSHFPSLRPRPHVLRRHVPFFNVLILSKKFRKLRFLFFRPLHIKQAKKNGHTAFENCVADLLLDDFHAVGVQFLLALFADGSLRS